MPLREPKILHFSQHFVLLLFYDAADETQRGRLKTLSVVRVFSDVSMERNTDVGFLCGR
jgi:hypothetical protein